MVEKEKEKEKETETETETEIDVEVKNEENLDIDNTVTETEVVLESVEEVTNTTEEKIEDILVEEIEEVKKESKESTFGKEILVGIIDQIVSILVALAILVVFNLILKLFGYYVAEKEPMFLIMYVLVNIIYAPVCKKFKFKSTVGQKLLLNK